MSGAASPLYRPDARRLASSTFGHPCPALGSIHGPGRRKTADVHDPPAFGDGLMVLLTCPQHQSPFALHIGTLQPLSAAWIILSFRLNAGRGGESVSRRAGLEHAPKKFRRLETVFVFATSLVGGVEHQSMSCVPIVFGTANSEWLVC